MGGLLRIGAFVASLRPALTQQDKRRVLEAFRALKPRDGTVRLGDWLARIQDPTLKNTIIVAFGAEDESQVADMGLTENVFMELLSDLAPLRDVSDILAL